MDFKCKQCKHEDNELEIIINENQYATYKINKDLSLEFIDSGSYGQEIFLQCPMCNAKYDFEEQRLVVEDTPTLKLLDIQNHLKSYKISNNDIKFKARKN